MHTCIRQRTQALCTYNRSRVARSGVTECRLRTEFPVPAVRFALVLPNPSSYKDMFRELAGVTQMPNTTFDWCRRINSTIVLIPQRDSFPLPSQMRLIVPVRPWDCCKTTCSSLWNCLEVQLQFWWQRLYWKPFWLSRMLDLFRKVRFLSDICYTSPSRHLQFYTRAEI